MHFVASHILCKCMSYDVYCVCIRTYTRCRCMCGMLSIGACVAWWFYVCDAHHAYVHLMEEKEMGVCWVWQLIQCVYRNNKGKSKDR